MVPCDIQADPVIAPHYPIYVPSKGRWKSRYTCRALDDLRVPYRVVIQPQDHDAYAAVLDAAHLLVLPFNDEKQGLLRARNWIWEHAISEGHKRHWQLDDNIRCFYNLHNGKQTKVVDPSLFHILEEHTDCFSNVALSGMQYDMFRKQGSQTSIWDKPFLLNTRIYSCTLILNSLPFRYRAAYNDDTDLSLQVLKAGWCTILYYCYLCKKLRTMTLNGGNTDELYKQDDGFDGRFEMAKSLYLQHPDVTKITRKWGRWQHQVDYRPFRHNKLKPVEPGVQVA